MAFKSRNFEFPGALLDLPAATVDYPNAPVDLPDGRVDRSDTIVDLPGASVDLSDGLVSLADALRDLSSASVNRADALKDLEMDSTRARYQRCTFWRRSGRNPGPRDVPARSAWGIQTGVGETLRLSGEPGRCDRGPVAVREVMERDGQTKLRKKSRKEMHKRVDSPPTPSSIPYAELGARRFFRLRYDDGLL